jgi:hypothetical protein
MTCLGMQIMVEGLGLEAFAMVRDFSDEPLAKALNAYVMQDEARHVAFGRSNSLSRPREREEDPRSSGPSFPRRHAQAGIWTSLFTARETGSQPDAAVARHSREGGNPGLPLHALRRRRCSGTLPPAHHSSRIQ